MRENASTTRNPRRDGRARRRRRLFVPRSARIDLAAVALANLRGPAREAAAGDLWKEGVPATPEVRSDSPGGSRSTSLEGTRVLVVQESGTSFPQGLDREATSCRSPSRQTMIWLHLSPMYQETASVRSLGSVYDGKTARDRLDPRGIMGTRGYGGQRNLRTLALRRLGRFSARCRGRRSMTTAG